MTCQSGCEYDPGHVAEHPCGRRPERPGSPCRYCGQPVPSDGTPCPRCWTPIPDNLADAKALLATAGLSADPTPKEQA